MTVTLGATPVTPESLPEGDTLPWQPVQRETVELIPDIDVRSAMHDMYDRMVVAEKAFERAKVLFKALQTGAEVERLLAGQGGLAAPSSPGIPADHVEALQRVVGILTDEATLAPVGLSFDGRRVRRRTGTRDELLDPRRS